MLELLIRIEKDKGFSHLLIDRAMKDTDFSLADRSLLTEVVYGTIQRKLTLNYYLNYYIDHNKKVTPWVRTLLQMSLYQMIYLDRVPTYAIIHEAVEIAKKRGHKGIASFVNGVLREIQRQGVPDTDLIEGDVKRLSIKTSHPEWLIKHWIHHYGLEQTKKMCEANLVHQPISVRVQPLLISRDEAMRTLREEGYIVKPSLFSPQGILILEGNILKSTLFKKNQVTIQDQSSMLVGEMMNVEPGMTVLDTCSAPGGKVTHIAEKMANEGQIYAHDLHEKKIQFINKKASSLQLNMIQATKHDARSLRQQYEKSTFDRILVDAPCSGLGVIRNKPEIKYHKKLSDIRRLSDIQLAILTEVAPLLKRNGLLVYSTCTVEPTENEDVVKRFLEKHDMYKVDESFFNQLPNQLRQSPGISPYGLQLFPQTYNTDGFFLTRLIKYK